MNDDIVSALESISVFNDPPADIHAKIDRAIAEINRLRSIIDEARSRPLFVLGGQEVIDG